MSAETQELKERVAALEKERGEKAVVETRIRKWLSMAGQRETTMGGSPLSTEDMVNGALHDLGKAKAAARDALSVYDRVCAERDNYKKDADKEWGASATARHGLEQLLTAEKEKIKKLIGYVDHDEECPVGFEAGAPRECSCGLNKVLESTKEKP
jgi:hypothetical protein